MTHCLTCGGAMGEPGKSYGYAGKWCHCSVTHPLQRSAPPEYYEQIKVITNTVSSDRDLLLNIMDKLNQILIELKK